MFEALQDGLGSAPQNAPRPGQAHRIEHARRAQARRAVAARSRRQLPGRPRLHGARHRAGRRREGAQVAQPEPAGRRHRLPGARQPDGAGRPLAPPAGRGRRDRADDVRPARLRQDDHLRQARPACSKQRGRKPLLVAADLQRPAAIDQLHVLGEQLDIPVYSDRTQQGPGRRLPGGRAARPRSSAPTS